MIFLDTWSEGVSISLSRRGTFFSSYPLSLFINGSDKVNLSYQNENWFYDDEIQLLGVLEEQAKLLEEYGFDWLDGKIDVDPIFRDNIAKAKERTLEEKEEIKKEISKHRTAWKERRVYPKKWGKEKNE